jgi:hypothetical protein
MKTSTAQTEAYQPDAQIFPGIGCHRHQTRKEMAGDAGIEPATRQLRITYGQS